MVQSATIIMCLHLLFLNQWIRLFDQVGGGLNGPWRRNYGPRIDNVMVHWRSRCIETWNGSNQYIYGFY